MELAPREKVRALEEVWGEVVAVVAWVVACLVPEGTACAPSAERRSSISEELPVTK